MMTRETARSIWNELTWDRPFAVFAAALGCGMPDDQRFDLKAEALLKKAGQGDRDHEWLKEKVTENAVLTRKAVSVLRNFANALEGKRR